MENKLQVDLNLYIKERHTQEECIGFIDGYKAAQKLNSISRLSMQEVLNYEVHSHWLAGRIGFEWGAYLMGKYFAWKIRRKYKRYLVSLEERKAIGLT